MYDCRKYNGHLSSTLTHQLCQVYRTMIEESDDKQNASIAVHIPQVQRQCASNDCGVFAIAFAHYMWHLVGDITFDQSKMRNHLLQCFKTRKLTPFPTVDKKARKRAELF